MTPYYGYGRGNKPYFYYQCTKRQHQGSCSMANVPAQPLEDVIARRLNQLNKEDRTIERLVKDAMAGTAELTANLEQRRADLQTLRTQVQGKIDALVESIADRRKALKSVGSGSSNSRSRKSSSTTSCSIWTWRSRPQRKRP